MCVVVIIAIVWSAIGTKHLFRLDRFPIYLCFLLAVFAGWMTSLEIYGVDIVMSEWQHTGYVTAIEQSSIIGVTKVFFKTDNSSSQEDIYCVKEETQLIPILQNASANSYKVTIKYLEYLHGGWLCEEGFTITAIE